MSESILQVQLGTQRLIYFWRGTAARLRQKRWWI